MKKIKIISLIQLPPPIHGASIINQRVATFLLRCDSTGNKQFRLNYARNFEEMHAPAIKKINYTISILWSIFLEYLISRPRITYISFSPFGLGFYRDFFFVAIARLFASTPFLHLHGTGLSDASKLKAILLRWMFSKSKVIVISPSLQKDVFPFTKKSNIVVIENCVNDPGEYKKIRSKKIKILYLANLDERKGVKTAIAAFEKIIESNRNFQLIIAGSDTSLLTKYDLQEHINLKYPKLKSYIEIVGAVYGNEKHNLFMESDVFLYPSQHDAAPLVVLEALSYGIPVICSSQGALPDMIQHGANGFISRTNSSSEYSELFYSCIERIDDMSLSARKIYLEMYSPFSFEKKLQNLFLSK